MSTVQHYKRCGSCWSSSRSSINPPVPSGTNPSATTSVRGVGQRLLSLLRALDKTKTKTKPTSNDSPEGSVDVQLLLRKILELFQQLTASVQRRGVLQGDEAVAQQVLAVTMSTSKERHGRPNHRKNKNRGRNGGSKSASQNDLSLHNNGTDDPAFTTTSGGGASALLDSQLLWSALARVLETCNHNSDNNNIEDHDNFVDWLVLAAAADLCTAASEYLKTRPSPDPCFLAEYELAASHGRTILSGLEQHIRSLLLRMEKSAPDELGSYALYACFRTASSLIGLFGSKLSRVNLSGLHELAMKYCCRCIDTDPRVTEAAAVLWAALSLASNAPAIQWNRAVTETVDALTDVLRTVAPVGVLASSTTSSKNAMEASSLLPTDKTAWNMIQEQWIPSMEQASSEDAKVQQFLQLVNGLVRVLQALLAREVVGVGAATAVSVQASLRDCQVNIDALLRLVDCLLNFTTAAESKFYATKKRLRPEPLTNGMLSPRALARDVANPLRWLGHALLDSVVTTLGTTALMPYARRISKMVQSALLVASSSTLRQALDPTAALLLQQQGRKRPRWLHTSVALRTGAIRSLQHVILLFGIDPQPMFHASTTSRHGKSHGSTTMDRAIAIVCGVVVEELVGSGSDQQQEQLESSDDNWGTFEERVQLVTAALDALTASLNCGGEFWSLTTRNLIDSVTVTGIALAQGRHPLTSQPSIQSALLSLGTASVVTPWPDGATTSTALVDGLQRLARAWSCHRYPSVTAAAVTALGVGKALSCPRVPALQIVTRTHGDSNNNNEFTESTVEFLAEKIKVVREDEKRARLREVEEAAASVAKAEAAAAAAMENSESKPSKRVKSSNPEERVQPMALSTANEPKKSEEKNSASSITTETRVAAVAHDQVEDVVEAQITKQSIENTLVDSGAIRQESGAASSEIEDDEDDFPMIVDCGPDDGE